MKIISVYTCNEMFIFELSKLFKIMNIHFKNMNFFTSVFYGDLWKDVTRVILPSVRNMVQLPVYSCTCIMITL